MEILQDTHHNLQEDPNILLQVGTFRWPQSMDTEMEC